MDQYLKEFRCGLFEANLESCRNVVNLRKREIVRQRYVTGKINPVSHALKDHFMQVNDLGKISHDLTQLVLKCSVAKGRITRFDRSGIALNVRKYGIDLRHFVAHFGLEHCYKVMSILER